MATQSPNDLFVVIDECHHAQAPASIRILGSLKERGVPILGLTATPFHIDERKTNKLWKFFDSPNKTPITRVRKQFLIENRFLARPKLKRVETKIEQKDIVEENVDITRSKTSESELKAYVLKRLAENPIRNQLIAKYYADNKELYGKTIIFTPETMANKLLVKELSDLGIEADYIDTYRKHKENQTVMQRFRTDDNFLVLVNTEMCTEGFDAPKTKTVFITRPTRSESLIQQMVGRAMRGREAGGNEECYLVTFVDTWKDFSPIDPEVVVNSENADAPITPNLGRKLIPIPETLIEECYRFPLSLQMGEILNSYEAIPEGWYEWDRPELQILLSFIL
jgi:ATP-dependent helicase IRC3